MEPAERGKKEERKKKLMSLNNLLPYLLSALQEYGYPILWLSIFIGAVGVPLPNTLLLLAAGAFAALGDFNLLALFLVSLSGFVAGDSCSYWIGRLWGSKVLLWLETSNKARFFKPQTIARSRSYFYRLGGWAIFLSRFLVSALGGAINLLAGAELYPYRLFFLYELAGKILGSLLPLVLGYIFAASWRAVGDILGSSSIFILAFLSVLFFSYLALSKFRRSRRAGRQQRHHEDPVDVSVASPRLSGSDAPSPTSSNLPL